MTIKNQPKDKVISTIKEWASPFLLSCIGLIVWNGVTEMRSDIKQLLMTQSADHIEILRLKEDNSIFRTHIFSSIESAQKEEKKNSTEYYDKQQYAVKQKDIKIPEKDI